MANEEIETVLGEDISFRGKLQFKNNLQINGRFKGQIKTSEADVETGTVSILGELQGNIVAARGIDLQRTARIGGDLRAPDLRMESGSRFSGNCIME